MPDQFKHHPALVSCDVVPEGDRFLITEVWDLKHPQCPIKVYDMTVWPFEERTDAISMTHRRRLDRIPE
jgi:hypothetical protein